MESSVRKFIVAKQLPVVVAKLHLTISDEFLRLIGRGLAHLDRNLLVGLLPHVQFHLFNLDFDISIGIDSGFEARQ